MKGAAIAAFSLQSRKSGPSGLVSSGASFCRSSRLRTVAAWKPGVDHSFRPTRVSSAVSSASRRFSLAI